MQNVTCNNCGAAIELRPEDIKTGFVNCPYCGGSIQLADKIVVQVQQEKYKERRVVVGYDSKILLPEQLNEPASKPANTKIELINEPGTRFHLSMARTNIIMVAIGIIWALTLLCGLVVDLVVGIFLGRAWAFIIIIGIILVIAFAGGIWFARRGLRHRDEIIALNGKFIIQGNSTIEFDWNRIADFHFSCTGGSTQGLKDYGLFMTVGKEMVQLWSFFSFATCEEQRWVLTELRRFFDSIWKS